MSDEIEEVKQNKKNDYQYIVGIGASAGGLEALQKFLSALPSDTGFPYIIIQHLSPDYKSLLGEILSKYTDMPVIQAENGMEIQANTIYVIQPGRIMRISGNKLYLTAQKEKELNLPIDMFFRSLAEDAGPRAISIILSGTGSDGTNGIKYIKEHDGMIIVQDVESSKFDGMPRSAMRTGLVDIISSPEYIALELQHISSTASKLPPPLKTDQQIDEELMKKVYVILKKVSNINFTHYKQTTIIRRIERRMMVTHKETLKDYLDFLYDSSEEAKTLSREVLIGVTSFFRDPEYFQCLKDKAIQNILVHSSQNEPIRVWVAGCSTGEEAYSIAILFCEVMDSIRLQRTVKIFATDLDYDSIASAGKGVYGDNIIETVSPARLSRYFSRKNNSYIINRDIRKMVVFSPHNVFQDPPFGRLDLISCRNMLIYFQPVLQNDLFALFHQALKDGGYLFLGKSEAIGAFTDAFPVVDAAAKIFTHRSKVKIPGSKKIPYVNTNFLDEDFADERDSRYARRSLNEDMPTVEQDKVDASMLEQFMPACLVINERNGIVRIFGECGNYMHFSTGNFSNNIFDLITEALKIPASTILKEAREKKDKVQYKDIYFHGEREEAVIGMTAMPVTKTTTGGESFYALVFIENNTPIEMPNAIPYNIDLAASRRITDLEQELSEVQEKLVRSIADQDVVNEELQAANEELLTANEELQSSNEELQSVNEELYTVNSEYQQKLTELAGLSDDIANFLSSTLTGIIFVDNKLNIRRYTDYVSTEFAVMEHDIGRSLKFISYHFTTVDIVELCENVIKTLIPDEREITTTNNKIFFTRIAPYRSTENKILGCVITFIDVTTQKQGQVKLESTEKELSVAQKVSDAKSDYLSHITLEMGAPMNALSALTKLIKQQSDDKELLNINIGKLTETVEYMEAILNNIADVSASDRRIIERKSRPFSIKDLYDSIKVVMNSRANNIGVQFDSQLIGDFSKKYLGSVTGVRQILNKLLDNAFKYTPKGGTVSLKIFEEADTMTNDTIGNVCIVVSDTGIGIAKEYQQNIFDAFSRATSGDENEKTSMGLGLSIVKRMIESMDGNIAIESQIGKGSTFTAHVKLKKYIAPLNAPDLSSKEINNLEGLKALIADDNAVNRMILRTILENEGVECVEAVNGEEAVALFDKSPDNFFAFILMDIEMPKIKGIRATQLIRESGRTDAQSVPIISISADGDSSDLKKMRDAGVNENMVKPISGDQLIDTILFLLKHY